jgi:hypothetical protein
MEIDEKWIRKKKGKQQIKGLIFAEVPKKKRSTNPCQISTTCNKGENT